MFLNFFTFSEKKINCDKCAIMLLQITKTQIKKKNSNKIYFETNLYQRTKCITFEDG